MFGATEAGRVTDIHGAALRVHSDDVSAQAGTPVVILEMKDGAVMLTRSQWALLVSYGDQVLGIHEDTAEGQQRRDPGGPRFRRVPAEDPRYACTCGALIPRGAFLAGYRVCRDHLPNPGYAGSYDAASSRG